MSLTAFHSVLQTLGHVTYILTALYVASSTRLCHTQYCTCHHFHYTKSWAHSITYCATYITALSCAIALYLAAHAKSCLVPTALHLQVASIGCIMGTQHCTLQHDQPQVTHHTLSVTYGTASIRLCQRPTALHTTLRTTIFVSLALASYSRHCIQLNIHKVGSQASAGI